MIGMDYAARQIVGAWRMAWNRPGWEDELDRSVDGVFQSFAAPLFAAPFYFLGYAAFRRAAASIPEGIAAPILEAPAAIAMPAQFLGVLADWAASVIALILIARAARASKRVAELIIGYNWIQIPMAAAQSLPLAVLSLAGGPRYAGAMLLPALAIVFAMLWGVLRRSLKTDYGSTVGIIILLTLIGLVAQSAATSLALSLFKALS